jgi:DNA repair protein RadC
MQKEKTFLILYKVQLVKDGYIPFEGSPKIQDPSDAEQAIRYLIDASDREMFVSVFLNTKNVITGSEIVSIGSLDSTIVHPREVFKAALLHNAASIIIGHNHPSGDPTPSREDIQVTNRLSEVGKLLGVEVLDHIIIGEGRFVSLRESGMM